MSHRIYFCAPGRCALATRRLVRPISRASHALAPGSTTTLLRRLMSRPDAPVGRGNRGPEPDRYLHTPDGPIALYERGEGPVVLFAHGWSGRAAQMRSLMDAAVATGHRAVAFDHYRHGRSGGADANLPLLIRACRAVSEDQESAGHEIVAGVAHSIGASAVLHASGNRVKRLFFIAPLVDIYPLLRERTLAIGVHPSVFDALIDQVNREYGLDHRAIDNGALLPSGEDVDIRIVHSGDDPVVPIGSSRALRRLPGVTELTELGGRSHSRILSHPRARQRIVRWLSGLPPQMDEGVVRARAPEVMPSLFRRPLSVAPLW